jgi:hypothetical protein
MPKSRVPTRTRRKAVLEIMNRGITSPTEIVKVLNLEYGIKTTRQTVHRDIADGIQPITEDIIEEHKESMLDNLDSLAKIAYNKGMRGDSTAMRTYSELIKTRATILQKIVEIQKELGRSERPIYKINIGEFPKIQENNDKKEEKREKKDNGE